MPSYLHIAQEVGQIARQAGAAILEVYQSDDFGTEQKADDSPLTRADKAANAVIVAGLEKLDFQAPIVSEELKEVAYEDRKDYAQFWLVDPLDGTKEFIRRNGDFTVNIALIEAGKPVVGVVFVPVTNELFYAATGEGAWLDGQPEALQAATFSLRDPGLKVVASRSHLSAETQEFIDDLQQPDLVSRGSSLKFLELARGRAHVYPRLAPTMEWDTGAAHCILLEAGGYLFDLDTQAAMTYNKPVLRNNHFLALGNCDKESLISALSRFAEARQ